MIPRLALALLVTCSAVALPACPSLADEDDDAAIEMIVSAAGEVLAIGDLCDWNFAAKVEKLTQSGVTALQLTPAQQKDMRARLAAARHATFGRLSAAGQARVRAEVCKPEERARLEELISTISFE